MGGRRADAGEGGGRFIGILIDVNLLIHAIDRDAPRHERARRWWEDRRSGIDLVRPAWATLLGFVRIATNRRVVPRPLMLDEVDGFVRSRLEQTCVVDPQAGHWERVRRFMAAVGAKRS